MLILLLALQLSTTNCISTANGGLHCSTITPQAPKLPRLPQAPPTPEPSGSGCALCNLISIFDGNAKKRHAKAVGTMLANGDCAGAERYALQKGDLDLADRVKARCASPRAQSLGPNEEIGAKETSSSESDWDFAKQPE